MARFDSNDDVTWDDLSAHPNFKKKHRSYLLMGFGAVSVLILAGIVMRGYYKSQAKIQNKTQSFELSPIIKLRKATHKNLNACESILLFIRQHHAFAGATLLQQCGDKGLVTGVGVSRQRKQRLNQNSQ